MNIILFGFKGCGKTHLGKLLAKRLNRPFVDTDDLIVKLYGKDISIRAIHQALGEQGFRELEAKALRQLGQYTNAVIALGGGAVLDPENVAYLQTIGRLVYLKADFATVKRRILRGGTPAFVEESLEKTFSERLPIYEHIPAQRVDVDRLDEAAVLEEIIRGL